MPEADKHDKEASEIADKFLYGTFVERLELEVKIAGLLRNMERFKQIPILYEDAFCPSRVNSWEPRARLQMAIHGIRHDDYTRLDEAVALMIEYKKDPIAADAAYWESLKAAHITPDRNL